jgi:hypothetical protein
MGGRATAFLIAAVINFAYNLTVGITSVAVDLRTEEAAAMLFGTIGLFVVMNGLVFMIFTKDDVQFEPPEPVPAQPFAFAISDEADDPDALLRSDDR